MQQHCQRFVDQNKYYLHDLRPNFTHLPYTLAIILLDVTSSNVTKYVRMCVKVRGWQGSNSTTSEKPFFCCYSWQSINAPHLELCACLQSMVIECQTLPERLASSMEIPQYRIFPVAYIALLTTDKNKYTIKRHTQDAAQNSTGQNSSICSTRRFTGIDETMPSGLTALSTIERQACSSLDRSCWTFFVIIKGREIGSVLKTTRRNMTSREICLEKSNSSKKEMKACFDRIP